MPSVWNLKKYKPEKGMLMNLAGDSHDARSVIIDSALGLLSAAPHNRDDFLEQIDWLVSYLERKAGAQVSLSDQRSSRRTPARRFSMLTAPRCHASERTGTRDAG